jgi:hypothetical protein
MRYFYLISAEAFHGRVAPALSACWRLRSFKPLSVCGIATTLTPDTPFRRDVWRVTVGETLLSCAFELPQLETPVELFAQLMNQPMADGRLGFSLIQQAIFGSHDLSFGGYYRPEHAGWNNTADVRRLTNWLESVKSENWSPANLAGATLEERQDELDFALEWFPELVAMYQRADKNESVIVSESV